MLVLLYQGVCQYSLYQGVCQSSYIGLIYLKQAACSLGDQALYNLLIMNIERLAQHIGLGMATLNSTFSPRVCVVKDKFPPLSQRVPLMSSY